MVILASFNYRDPPMIIFIIGWLVALSLLIPIYHSRSILVGIFGGAIGWGLIAVIVFGTGSGDMTGLLQLVYGCFFAVVGSIAGLIASLIGKVKKKAQIRNSLKQNK